ncbi:MAG: DnaJ C-terminal domain-containing protein [Deinococcota bacterium]
MAAYKDYYNTLGVSKTASQQEIRAAFRKLAAKHHPDRNPDDPSAEETFKEINEAYIVLSDDEKRSMYDRFGTTDGIPGGFGAGNFAGGGDFSDFFQSLFGGGGFGSAGGTGGFSGSNPFEGFQTSSRSTRPSDVRGNLNVSLEQAFYGTTTMIAVDNKRIEVSVPKGVKEGAKLRLRGQAPSGGDIYLTVQLDAHSIFSLDGDNVRVTVNVPDYIAALGGNVRVPTLEGDVDMTLPPKIQAGRTLRLRGQGWYRRDGSRGDELAEVRIVIPSDLSDEQHELYTKLRELAESPAVMS